MTYTEMKKKILDVFPNAQIEIDNSGQVLIYTDKMIDGDTEEVIDFELDDE